MDEYIAKRGKRIAARVADIEVIASVLTEIDAYDRAVEAEALDALMRWGEGEGEGEGTTAPEEETRRVWLAAWWACREAVQLPAAEADQTGTGVGRSIGT